MPAAGPPPSQPAASSDLPDKLAVAEPGPNIETSDPQAKPGVSAPPDQAAESPAPGLPEEPGPVLQQGEAEPEPVAPEPEPEPEPSSAAALTAALNASSRNASARAWAGLYRLWGYDSDALTDQQACARAPAAGMRCIQAAGSLGILRRFDRPAILLLMSGEGRRVPVLLRGMMGGRVALEIDGQPLEVSSNELEASWYGEYRLLWRVAPSGSTVLRPGYRSNDVRWLREQLQRITGETDLVDDPRLYDATLKARVAAFQRQQGLVADGVAGGRTLIMLNNLIEGTDVPRLKIASDGAGE